MTGWPELSSFSDVESPPDPVPTTVSIVQLVPFQPFSRLVDQLRGKVGHGRPVAARHGAMQSKPGTCVG